MNMHWLRMQSDLRVLICSARFVGSRFFRGNYVYCVCDDDDHTQSEHAAIKVRNLVTISVRPRWPCCSMATITDAIPIPVQWESRCDRNGTMIIAIMWPRSQCYLSMTTI